MVPLRDIDGHGHDKTRNETSARDGQAPTNEDLAKLLPVNAAQISVGQGYTNNSTSDALGGGNGKTKLAGKKDSNGSGKLHGVATRRRVLGDAVTQVAHNVVAKSPETNTESKTTNCLDPGRGVSLGGGDARVPGHVFSRKGADGVGYIVGTVGYGHDHGGADLGGGPEKLDLILEDGGTLVDVLKAAGLVCDDVAGNAVEGNHLGSDKETARVSPGKLVDSLEVLLALHVDLGLGIFFGRSGLGLVAELNALFVGVVAVLLLGEVVVRAVTDVLGGVVVGHNGSVGRTRPVQVVTILKQERAHGNVPEAKAVVLLDQLGLEVWNEEDGRDDEDAGEDTENNASGLTSTQLLWSGNTVATIHDDEKSENTGSDGVVERNDADSSLEGILARVNEKTDGKHDDGAKTGGDERSNTPRRCNLAHRVALPAPFDLKLEGDANTDEGTNKRLSGRDGEAHASTSSEPDGRTGFSDDHGKNEGARRILEGVEREDTLSNGFSDLLTEGNGTNEFSNNG